jgi:nifR3 family TIM-barrel protein
MSIYKNLKKPIYSLAPMEDVTDSVFRQVVASVGKPDLFYTEFVNVEGLNSKGRKNVIHRLQYSQIERPIIAQLWGIKPENFFLASKLVSEMGFDGIDINMGCSVKKVSEKDAGAGLIRADREVVKDIINAVKEGACGLPVSVKTRLGWEDAELDGWISFLLDQSLDALTLHMRTARGVNAIHANWDHTSRIKELRDIKSPTTLLFGNGDIHSISEAREMVNTYNIDGAMIGRAAISNPWVFTNVGNIVQEEKFLLLKKHLLLYESTWGEKKDFHAIKKFFKAYINGFEGAVELREEFMRCSSTKECLTILEGLI